MVNKKIKLVNFPEEVTTEGVRIYGETSYENQMALLSHFLHNQQKEMDLSQREEVYSGHPRVPFSQEVTSDA